MTPIASKNPAKNTSTAHTRLKAIDDVAVRSNHLSIFCFRKRMCCKQLVASSVTNAIVSAGRSNKKLSAIGMMTKKDKAMNSTHIVTSLSHITPLAFKSF